MNRSTVLIIAFGFFFALVAALAVQMIGGKKAAQNTVAAPTVSVLIAAKDIKAGEKLAAGSTQWAVWPEETAKFPGAVLREGTQKPADALQGRVKRAIAKGEPLTHDAMIEDAKANFIAASLTTGKRAVTISVNAQSSVGGFVSPGDRVDVVMTYDVKLPSDDKIRKAAVPVINKLAAETILENLRVLAVDQDAGKKADAKVGKTVTLEAAPREAETLLLASKMGTLALDLRPLGDDAPDQAADAKAQPVVTDTRVSGVMREIMKGENKSGSLAQVVRVYTGTRVDNIEVRPYTSQ